MQEWVNLRRKKEKLNYPLTRDMLETIDRFYFNHYCLSFRSGAFARANSSMYVCLDLYIADLIIRIVPKPYGEYAWSVDAPRPSPAAGDDFRPQP